MRQVVGVLVGLLLVAVLIGCGGKRRAGVVTGKVTYKEQPVNDAALLLYPVGDAKAEPIIIPVTHEGTYRISDVPEGDYKIAVQGSPGASEAPLTDIPPERLAEVKEKLEKMKTPATIPFPKKYTDRRTSPLECEITDQNQTMDLDLKD